MIFVDSNIFCYFFDKSAGEHGRVSKFLEKVLSEKRVALNTVVAMEVAHFLNRNLGHVFGKEKMDEFLSFPFEIDGFDYVDLLSSMDFLTMYGHSGIGGREVSVLASMSKLGITEIVTHDRAFRQVDSITVLDPL